MPIQIADPEKVKALSKGGMNNSEVGRELGISRERVRVILGENSRRKPRVDLLVQNEASLREAVARLKAGASLRRVAQDAGADEETIKRAMIRVVGQDAVTAALLESGAAATAALAKAKGDYWIKAGPVGLLTILGVKAVPRAGHPGSDFRAILKCACGTKKETPLRSIRLGVTLCCGGSGCRSQVRGRQDLKDHAIDLGRGEPRGRVYP